MKIKNRILYTVFLIIAAVALVPNIYFIAGKLGLSLAPNWYQDMVDWVSAGGTIGGAFAAILGITVSPWLVAIASAFGVVSA